MFRLSLQVAGVVGLSYMALDTAQRRGEIYRVGFKYFCIRGHVMGLRGGFYRCEGGCPLRCVIDSAQAQPMRAVRLAKLQSLFRCRLCGLQRSVMPVGRACPACLGPVVQHTWRGRP